MSKPNTSLVELCRDTKGARPDGERAYRVKVGGETKYVFAKSKGQAALACATVETVTQRELTEAAFEAIGVQFSK